MTNVSLVGFGRIGRDLFRQTLGDKDINIVSISDTADKKNLIYLLKYDSIYGKLNAEIHETETGIVVDGKEIIFNSWKDGDEADWVKIGTDVVVLATGKPKTKEEVDAAWDKLKYEGWWYTIDEWKKVRDKYVKDMYNGDYEKAPKVYCLNKKYKDRL